MKKSKSTEFSHIIDPPGPFLTGAGWGSDARFALTEDFLEKRRGDFIVSGKFLKGNGILEELESRAVTLRI